MSETPKITLHHRTPEEEAHSKKEAERKNRLIDREYSRAVSEIVENIPDDLSDVDKLAVLYSVFLDTMTYDFEWSKSVNEDGTVNRPADPSGDKYDLVIEGEHLHIDGEKLAVLKGVGVCEHFAKAFADIASKLGVPCGIVQGKTKATKTIAGNETLLGHAWNWVETNGEIEYIDVTYGIFANDVATKDEKGIAPDKTAADFFLVNGDELRRIGPHRDFKAPSGMPS